MTALDMAALAEVVTGQPYPLVFATVSGAHLYSFPSRDSDIDLRGAHILPPAELLGLRVGPETLTRTWHPGGVELDLVTHDVAKFFRMLLRPNGYVLEQLLSPLVVVTSDEHRELVALAPSLVTRHHAHHYRGFANSQWKLFTATGELKPLLYTFRALLTGIRLMRTGTVVASLDALAGDGPAYLPELIEAKAAGEHANYGGGRPVEADIAQLHARLEEAAATSQLPDRTWAEPALHDLLLRLRVERH